MFINSNAPTGALFDLALDVTVWQWKLEPLCAESRKWFNTKIHTESKRLCRQYNKRLVKPFVLPIFNGYVLCATV